MRIIFTLSVLCSLGFVSFESYSEEEGVSVNSLEEQVVNGKQNFQADSLNSQRKPEDFRIDEALKVINENIKTASSGNSSDIDRIFTELRKMFSCAELSNAELLELIDDAIEVRKKYHLILDCVARVEFAKRSIKRGISSRVALQLSSSEYIQLPGFVLKEEVNEAEFNKMVSDIGCGIVWKDRLKYLFAQNRYFGSNNNLSVESFRFLPSRTRNYVKVLEENDKFCQRFYNHLRYVMAQDYYYAGISKEDIVNIFNLTKDEWNGFVKPGSYS